MISVHMDRAKKQVCISWQSMGDILKSHPATYLGITLGSLIFAFVPPPQ